MSGVGCTAFFFSPGTVSIFYQVILSCCSSCSRMNSNFLTMTMSEFYHIPNVVSKLSYTYSNFELNSIFQKYKDFIFMLYIFVYSPSSIGPIPGRRRQSERRERDGSRGAGLEEEDGGGGGGHPPSLPRLPPPPHPTPADATPRRVGGPLR